MWLRVVGINDIIGISLDLKIFFVIWLFFKGWLEVVFVLVLILEDYFFLKK